MSLGAGTMHKYIHDCFSMKNTDRQMDVCVPLPQWSEAITHSKVLKLRDLQGLGFEVWGCHMLLES